MTDKIVRRWVGLLPVDERKRAGGGPKRHQPLLRVTAFDRFHGFRELFVADEQLERGLLIGLRQGLFVQVKGTGLAKGGPGGSAHQRCVSLQQSLNHRWIVWSSSV